MAHNTIQFQHGLSLPEFLQQYGREEQCCNALFKIRSPNGLICPSCHNTTHCQLSRGVYQYHRCRHQASLIAGTIFHGTHLPLTTWFLARVSHEGIEVLSIDNDGAYSGPFRSLIPV
jgi:ribosomal protein L37AE/L43A